MPRKPRLHVPGAFYHLTLRGNHRQDIFFSPSDRDLFDQLTQEVLDRFRARLHAFCWMTNHVHLLVQVSDVPLGQLVLRIAGQYARRIQKHLRTTGHLFEKRYHAVLVDADEYLLELIRYIHLNPVRARMVASPSQYRWSSHLTYLDKCERSWVTTDFALSAFHQERSAAIAAYERFVNQEIGKISSSPLLEVNSTEPRILGNDEFAGKLLGDSWKPKSRKSLQDLIGEACQLFGVTEADLRSSSAQATHQIPSLGRSSGRARAYRLN
ncbi:MAG TPA: transposase [Steroidobacteraceae bacterium]|nr:transposase [Steroidobacteraceae bacterium]